MHTAHGVLQGSVLSPLLFALTIDDLLHALNSEGLKCYAYADDAATRTPCKYEHMCTLHARPLLCLLMLVPIIISIGPVDDHLLELCEVDELLRGFLIVILQVGDEDHLLGLGLRDA